MRFKISGSGVVALIFLIKLTSFAQELFDSERKLNYRLSLINESNYNWLNSTPLNQDNKLVPQNQYGHFASTDLFLSWKYLSLTVKGTANYTDREQPDYKGFIREFYFDHSLSDFLHLTIGRKILKWGTGYAFNPTGVVEPTKEAADPSDRLNRYQGRQIIALDAFLANSSFNLVYTNEAAYHHRINWGKNELAFRYYSLIKDVDLSLVSHWQENEKIKFGFNTAYTYGSHIEFHSEFIAQRGTNKLYHQVLDSLRYQIYFDMDPYMARYKNSGKIFPRLLIGAQYTFDSGVNLMAEYFYNREGLTAKEWNQWRQFILFHQRQIVTIPPSPLSFQNFYNGLLTLEKQGSMRHYGFVRLYFPQQRSGLEIMLFSNLIDYSGAGIVMFNFSFNSYITSWIRGELYTGERNSEFGLLFIRNAVNLGVKISL